MKGCNQHPFLVFSLQFSMENFRNKGVAPSVVPLFVEAVCSQQNVQYFIIRINASNFHSKHVFEKLGAKFMEEEKSFYRKIMKKLISFKENTGEASKLSENYEADDKPVYVYKLSADMLLPREKNSALQE